MNKKKLIEYTAWILMDVGRTEEVDRKFAKKLLKSFLKEYPDFFEEPLGASPPEPSNPWDELFQSREPVDEITGSNPTLSGTITITYTSTLT